MEQLFTIPSSPLQVINPLGVNIDIIRPNLTFIGTGNEQQLIVPKEENSVTISSSEDDWDGDSLCSICLDDVNRVSRTKPCKHRFCQSCLLEWIFQKFYCPFCRQRIAQVDFRYRHRNRQRLLIPPDLINNTITKLLDDNVEFFHMLAAHVLDKLYSNPDQLKPPTAPSDAVVIHLNYDGVSRAFYNSCTPNQITQFFRYFVYRECLKQEEPNPFAQVRTISLEYFRQRPAMTHRLLGFFYRETLHFLMAITTPSVILANNPQVNLPIFSSRAKDLLLKYDMQSKEFRRDLYELFIHFYPKYYVSPRMVAKFHEELISFARSTITDFEAYLAVTNYIFPDKIIEEVTVVTTDSDDSDIQIVQEIKPNEKKNGTNKRMFELAEEEPVPGPSGITDMKKRKLKHDSDDDCQVVDSPPPPPPCYTKNQVREMRRVIRLAYDSPYYYQKLIVEIKKMFYNLDSVLDSPHFAHLREYFKSVLRSTSLYKRRTLSLQSSKRSLTLSDIDQWLNQRPHLLPVGMTGQYSSDSSSFEDDDQDVNTSLRISKFESSHRRQINQSVIDYVKSPLNRPYLPQPSFIQYRSRDESSESDW